MKAKTLAMVIAEIEQIRSHLETRARQAKIGNGPIPTGVADQELLRDIHALNTLIAELQSSGVSDLTRFAHRLADARAATLGITGPLLVPVLGHQVAAWARTRLVWPMIPLFAIITFLGFRLWNLLEDVSNKAKFANDVVRRINKVDKEIEKRAESLKSVSKEVQITAEKASKRSIEAEEKLSAVDQLTSRAEAELRNAVAFRSEAERWLKETRERIATNTETVPQPAIDTPPPDAKYGWLLAAFTNGNGDISGWNVTIDGKRPQRKEELVGHVAKPLVEMRLREKPPTSDDLASRQINYSKQVGKIGVNTEANVLEVREVPSEKNTPQLWIRVPISK